MKNNFERFSKNLGSAFLVLSLSLATTSNAQTEYTLSPDISSSIIQSYGMQSFKVYRVSYREVEYHKLDTLQVESKQYKYVKELLQKYQPDYDKYNAALANNTKGKEAIDKIVANLDAFLTSKEKYKKKEKFLEDAQKIATDNKLQGIFDWQKANKKSNSDADAVISFVSGSRLEDEDINRYKQKIQQITFPKPQETYNYQEYVRYSKELETVPKTELGVEPSKETSKRMAFMLEEPVDVLKLSGKFVEMKGYMLANREVPEKFLKDEIANDLRGIYNSGQLGSPYPLLKKQGTEEYYYVVDETFLPYVFQRQMKEELLQMVHDLGYKEYSDEYGSLYIKSKTSEIRLSERTYWELKKDPQYITKLDADQTKIAALVKQTPPHSKTLDKYLSLYNVQKRNMSSADLKAWRNATENAQKLHNQIYEIGKKYDGNTSFKLLDKSNTFDNFLDNLLASKGVLGM
jgi:hypothetical protein